MGREKRYKIEGVSPYYARQTGGHLPVQQPVERALLTSIRDTAVPHRIDWADGYEPEVRFGS